MKKFAIAAFVAISLSIGAATVAPVQHTSADWGWGDSGGHGCIRMWNFVYCY